MPGSTQKKNSKKKNRNWIKKKSYWFECPLNEDPIWVPVSAFQIRIEKSPFPPSHSGPSPPPLTNFVPQGEKHTERTGSLCPLSVDTQSPVFVFQSLTLLSSLPLAKIVESGLQATELTLRLR